MKYLYLFDASGRCFAVSFVWDGVDIERLAAINGAVSHVTDTQRHDIRYCTYVGGGLRVTG